METAPTFDDIREAVKNGEWEVNYDSTGYVIVDGVKYRVRTETDDYMSIFDEQGDGVWCGQLQWSDRDYGRSVRPSNFNGSAEILVRENRSDLWWQPLEDCKPGSDIRAAVRSTVLDVFNYGYVLCYVQSIHGFQAMGGVEAMSTEYHIDVFADLICELHYDLMVKRWNDQWTMSDMERWTHKSLDNGLARV